MTTSQAITADPRASSTGKPPPLTAPAASRSGAGTSPEQERNSDSRQPARRLHDSPAAQGHDALGARHSGRRALRGAVLLASLLGGLSAMAASGIPAYAADNHSPDFYYNIDGHPAWHASTIAGTGTTYSAPAMDRFATASGLGTLVTAQR